MEGWAVVISRWHRVDVQPGQGVVKAVLGDTMWGTGGVGVTVIATNNCQVSIELGDLVIGTRDYRN